MDTNYPHINDIPRKPQIKPKRMTYRQGWKLYRGAFILHHIQGYVVGLLIVSDNFPTAAALWAVLYCCYQVACYPRKRDSMGLDICDLIVGYLLGLLTIMPLILLGVI